MALDPNKIVLCWPNYVPAATLSGGSWVPTLPLAHVQDRRLSVVAKTASLDPADTRFTLTLPGRRRLHAVAIAAHNLSPTATVRARAYRDAERTDEIADTGVQNVWPIVYTLNDVIWGDDNFWNRRLSEEDRATYTPLMILFFDERVIGTAVDVELSDPGNPDGAIELGRVILTDAWQPEYNISYGVQHGYNSGTTMTEARDPSRTEYADEVTPKRTVSFDLKLLNEDEAFLRLHRLQRTQDIVGELLYVYSVTPSPANFARAMLCRQETLNPITHPYFANYENPMALLEIL
ncbi:MAG: hypothetical protein Tp170SUR00d2C46354221_52 [Prokaryotic dsDNA virus sp.]|jgi:hypothetical protein|nr:MAG: hypothetical protein Unbinned4contig1000_7 [Prokaryotic dsDNA virus sp.]QDP48145.1 MAG: hypothetical protein Tp170SUR00d2C46354221_52 [Prokaryotic dsDNA virus sp.]QDP53246.1 MAG: hypothetical protein Unbinned28contig1000_2 [Prokaryotic dsDNA virus sp.]HAO01702.1 hypothetical protein [Halomonas sp.]|tara:strand:- start:36054 stop:36929 length:876 start_codon:yes stop_codon:yes gene_type:complete